MLAAGRDRSEGDCVAGWLGWAGLAKYLKCRFCCDCVLLQGLAARWWNQKFQFTWNAMYLPILQLHSRNAFDAGNARRCIPSTRHLHTFNDGTMAVSCALNEKLKLLRKYFISFLLLGRSVARHRILWKWEFPTLLNERERERDPKCEGKQKWQKKKKAGKHRTIDSWCSLLHGIGCWRQWPRFTACTVSTTTTKTMMISVHAMHLRSTLKVANLFSCTHTLVRIHSCADSTINFGSASPQYEDRCELVHRMHHGSRLWHTLSQSDAHK